jgi:DNA polymerase III alpha subunit
MSTRGGLFEGLEERLQCSGRSHHAGNHEEKPTHIDRIFRELDIIIQMGL